MPLHIKVQREYLSTSLTWKLQKIRVDVLQCVCVATLILNLGHIWKYVHSITIRRFTPGAEPSVSTELAAGEGRKPAWTLLFLTSTVHFAVMIQQQSNKDNERPLKIPWEGSYRRKLS
jgi:hypothetical protein